MSYKKIQAVLILILLTSSFIVPITGYAATDNPQVYLTTATKQLAPGSKFTVQVLIDTPQPINAIDIDVNYSRDLIELISINSSKSFIDFWRSETQPPSTGSTINLQGGSIDPFLGNGGEIISLNFKAIKEGSANLSFGKTNLYYADGKGTLAQARGASPLNFAIVTGAALGSLESSDFNEDKTAPVIETARVARDPIDRSRLAIFRATDEGSGVKNTEIRLRKWFSWSDWQIVTNPVRLPSTAWVFQLKATDNSGNSAEKTVYVPQATLSIAIPIFAILVFIIINVYKRRRNRLG